MVQMNPEREEDEMTFGIFFSVSFIFFPFFPLPPHFAVFSFMILCAFVLR